MFSSNSQKKRTRVACDTCRRKKIKCSGETPCTNCIQSKEPDCKYTEKPIIKTKVEKRNDKKVTPYRAMSNMESRLAKLEDVIGAISNKLDFVRPRDSASPDSIRSMPGIGLSSMTLPDAVRPKLGLTGMGLMDMGQRTEIIRPMMAHNDIVHPNMVHPNGHDHQCGQVPGSNGCGQGPRPTLPKLEADSSNRTSLSSRLGLGESSREDDEEEEEDDDDEDQDSDETDNSPKGSIEENSSKGPSLVIDESWSNFVDPTPAHRKVTLDNDTIRLETEMYQSCEQFFESHSFFSICSTKSIKWITDSLEDQDKNLIRQFERLPFYIFARISVTLKGFLNPIELNASNREKYLLRPVPADYEYFELLLDITGFEQEMMCNISPMGDIKKLMKIYFSKERTLNSSELLIVCGAAYLCLVKKFNFNVSHVDFIRAQHIPTDVVKALNKYSDGEVLKMLEQVLESSILLYHRVCVIGHGITTIQGILMLLIGLEASGVSFLDISSMLLAVAIRYAKMFGLHRAESYAAFCREEATFRRNIWYVCLHCDIEFCYRNGKSPILSEVDVNISSKTDLSLLIEFLGLDLSSLDYFDSKAHIGYLKPEVIKRLHDEGEDEKLLKYFHFVLIKLRFHAYFTLFLNVGNFQTVQNLEMYLDDLNTSSTKLSNLSLGNLRPTFYDELRFDSFFDDLIGRLGNDNVSMKQLNFQFMFFYHVMLTNRVPFLTNITNESPKISTFRKLFIRSARTVLHIGLKLNFSRFRSFALVWLAFYPFAAFLMLLTVLLNNPNYPEAREDFELLLEISSQLFEVAFSCKKAEGEAFTALFNFQCITMKIFAQIAVAIFKKKTGQVIEFNDRHKDQLALLKKRAPEIFHSKAPKFDMQVLSAFNEGETLSNSGTSYSSSPRSFSAPDTKEVNSPSYNPSLANLINHDRALENSASSLKRTLNNVQYPGMGETPPVQSPGVNGSKSSLDSHKSPDFFDNVFGEDGMNNIFADQMSSLPNFFFDNNLGF